MIFNHDIYTPDAIWRGERALLTGKEYLNIIMRKVTLFSVITMLAVLSLRISLQTQFHDIFCMHYLSLLAGVSDFLYSLSNSSLLGCVQQFHYFRSVIIEFLQFWEFTPVISHIRDLLLQHLLTFLHTLICSYWYCKHLAVSYLICYRSVFSCLFIVFVPMKLQISASWCHILFLVSAYF